MRQWIFILAMGVVVALCVSFDIVRVRGDSMRPTLCDTDVAIAVRPWLVRSAGLLSRIVVYDDGEARLNIKRAVGVAGDRVRIERGRVVRNDEFPAEDYLCDSDANLIVSWPGEDVPGVRATYEVQAGELLLVGDNRPISVDSRADGAVAESKLKGVVVATLPRFLQQAEMCTCK